jgi:hypothetical protein
MPAAYVTISAKFDDPQSPGPASYSVHVSPLSGGTVSASQTSATAGTTLTLTVTPEVGYRLTSGTLKATGGDVAISESEPYTFTMPAAHVTVSAEFEALPPDTYTVSIDKFDGGTVGADKTSAAAGTTITLTVKPDEGYVLVSGSLKYSYGGNDYTPAVSGTTYIFTMPAADVTVSALFNPGYGITIEGPQARTITVTAEHSKGAGHPSPAEISFTGGEWIKFTVDGGYTVEDNNLLWVVDILPPDLTGNTLTVNARNYVLKSYTLTVMVKEDGQWYSTNIVFRVVE